MFARTQSMSLREFMKPEKKEITVDDIIKRINDPKVKRIIATTTTIILITKFGPIVAIPHALAHAAPEAVPVISTAVKSKILHAFDPLIEVVKALSYPIAAVMITAGCLFIMVGNKEKGMSMIQMAGIGYILVQLAPVFMQILVGIGGAV